MVFASPRSTPAFLPTFLRNRASTLHFEIVTTIRNNNHRERALQNSSEIKAPYGTPWDGPAQVDEVRAAAHHAPCGRSELGPDDGADRHRVESQVRSGLEKGAIFAFKFS